MTPAQGAEYVRLDLAALRRGIVGRLKPGYKASTYDEGWNDALYLLLDILDGSERIDVPEVKHTCRHGVIGSAFACSACGLHNDGDVCDG